MSTPSDSFEPYAQGDETTAHASPPEEEQGPTDPPTTEPAEEAQPASQEPALPPEAQGETNGGPLGCCLGTIAGIFLVVLFTTGLPLLLFHHALPGGIALPVSLVGAILCGFLGWKIGKRVYREYELSPRQRQKLEEWEKRRMEQQARKRRR